MKILGVYMNKKYFILILLVVLIIFVSFCGDHETFIEIKDIPKLDIPPDNDLICKDEIEFSWTSAGKGVDSYIILANSNIIGETKELSFKIKTSELLEITKNNEIEWKAVAKNEFQYMPSEYYKFTIVNADDPFLSVSDPCSSSDYIEINLYDTRFVMNIKFNNKDAEIIDNRARIAVDKLNPGTYLWTYNIKVDMCESSYSHSITIGVEDPYIGVVSACEGADSVSISFNDASNVKNIKFDNKNASLSNNQAIFSMNNYPSGTYHWTYELVQGFCSDSFSHSVTISPKPVINNTYSPSGGEAPYIPYNIMDQSTPPPDLYEIELLEGVCSSLNHSVIWSNTTANTTAITPSLNPVQGHSI